METEYPALSPETLLTWRYEGRVGADPGDRCITSMIIICTIWVPRGWLAAHVGFFAPVRF